MHTFDAATEHLARIVADYALNRLKLNPVPLDGPKPYGELAAAVGETITAAGLGPDETLRIFTDVLAPACISNDSTRYLAFIPAAPTKAALLFDEVVGASSLCGVSWLEAAGAVYAENQALRFLADEAGLPAAAGGCFMQGGSVANLSALVVARETTRAREHGGAGRTERLAVAVGEQTHSSVASTLQILDLDEILVPSDENDRLTGPELAYALDSTRNVGPICAVVATAGTTNAGIVDDLASVAAVCKERDLWMHVDAAYGGAALLAPSARQQFAGIEHADSLVIDPHKWLFAPFDCAALLYRAPELARRVHRQHASYLEAMHHDDADEWNPSDYGYHLTRRARGLPFWFSMAMHGTDAYRDAVERTLAVARQATERIRATPYLELVREPELSVVLFRRRGWNADDYGRWSEALLRDQIGLVLPTKWDGEVVARLCFLHPDCEMSTVDEILATMA